MSGSGVLDRYALLNADVWQTVQERQRATWRLFGDRLGWHDLSKRALCEVGCGAGGNLVDFVRMGFDPQRLTGLELLPERAAMARRVLPETVELIVGDALDAPVTPCSQDVVFQAVVFSSLKDDAVQRRLAERMWSWVRPGGGVLWYDFVYDNPSNLDVRGMPVRRVRELFPHAGAVSIRRVTLAPPIARRVCRIHPAAYSVANALPFLRTHVLLWLAKTDE